MPRVGAVELAGRFLTKAEWTIGGLGELRLLVDVAEGDVLGVYHFDGDVPVYWEMFRCLSAPVGSQLRWSVRESKEMNEHERKSLTGLLKPTE